MSAVAPDDVLSLLVGARDADGAPLSDLEIRDQLVGLAILGREITSAGIAWPLERLSRVRRGDRPARGRDGYNPQLALRP